MEKIEKEYDYFNDQPDSEERFYKCREYNILHSYKYKHIISYNGRLKIFVSRLAEKENDD